MPLSLSGGTTTTLGGNIQAGASGGSSSGTINNTQSGSTNTTQNQTGSETQNNVYLPWQQTLGGQTGAALGNYITSGGPPPGVTGANDALNNAYTHSYMQNVAPQMAAAQGPGTSAIGSGLALGLEQLNADVYGTNLNAYLNATGQAGPLSLTPTGETGQQSQSSTGHANSNTTNNTTQNQDWQQAMANLMAMATSVNSAGFSTT